jgi:isoleucyl-tRNA synthetase
MLTLWNVYKFFVDYARIDGFSPHAAPARVPASERPVLDRWLLSRLTHLEATCDAAMTRFDVNGASRPIETFVEDLSTWYVRRSRRRFWKSESDADKAAAYQTLHTALTTLARLLAPFMPFLSEAMYKNLTGARSVHLTDYPNGAGGHRDERLEAQMATARRAVEVGLAARDAARIKVRQPLAAATLPGEALPDEIAEIVREELNVKELRFGGEEVVLDTEITEPLRLEGLARDIVRQVQQLRKDSGFNLDDRIRLAWRAEGELARAMAAHTEYIAREVLAVAVERSEAEGLVEKKIEGQPIWLKPSRVE